MIVETRCCNCIVRDVNGPQPHSPQSFPVCSCKLD